MSRSRPGIRRGAVDRVWNVYPDPRVIHLGDRALTVEDAGPDRGFPVLVHCGGGSRHLSPAAVREARLHGFRLISYDRPGYGGSTPMPDRVIADCCADVEAILGGLGISRIAVWGFSGGGPYALATAALLPNAVTAVCLFAPLGPYGAAGLDFLDGMADSYREEVRIFFSDRAAAREKFRSEAAEMFGRLSTPRGWLAQWGDRAGKDAAHGQEAADYLASIYQDGWTHGDDGWWDDWSAFLGPWGFDLAAITAPVSLWHGLADTRCPPGHSRWLAERMPRMTTHFPETEDHTNIEDNNRTAAYEWLRGLLTDQALPLAQERNRHLRSGTQEHRASMVAPRRAGTPVRYVAQPPVTANQTPTPAGPVTKMIGAMQGWGRLTMALILEFPAASALKLSVLMLVIAAEPSAPMLWQLTMARKSGNGFVPRSAAGTDGWSARTSPCTFTSR